MQHYLLYVFRAISKIVRMMIIPMTMRAIMAPEPETDGEGREAFILIACFSVTASYLHVRFHRFPCCTVYLICPVGVCSSLAKKSLTYKQSVTATALESKLIALNRVDIYKPWLKSFYFIDTRSNTWSQIRCATTLTLDEYLFFGLRDGRGVRGGCGVAHRWGDRGLHLQQSPARKNRRNKKLNANDKYCKWSERDKKITNNMRL